MEVYKTSLKRSDEFSWALGPVAPQINLIQGRVKSAPKVPSQNLLHEHIGAMCRLVPSTGRGAQRLDSHILYHQDSLLAPTATNHTIEKLAATAAKPVLAHRATIPAAAATVPLENFLKGRRRHIFENQQLLQQERPLGDPPKPCHMISRHDEHLR